MERQIRMISPLLFLLLLVTASEMGAVMGGTNCEAPSSEFKGICFNEKNCDEICQGEGFASGGCEGFRRRCMCTKPC